MSCQQRAELSVCRRGDLQVTSHGAWPYKWCLRFSFFMSVACLFILLPVSFAEMFLILMKSNFFFLFHGSCFWYHV